jgi:hypothetical protein
VISVRIAALTEGVIKAMRFSKLKAVTVLLALKQAYSQRSQPAAP